MSSLLFALLGGALYRWRGHASKYKKFFPRPFNQIVFSLPYAYFAYLSDGLLAGSLCLVLTTLFVLTGRGNFFLGSAFKYPYDPETLEIIIIGLKGKIPDYWYKCLGMSLVGACATLSCGVVEESYYIAFSGALMAPAYMLGQGIYDLLPKVKKEDASGSHYYGIECLPRHLDYNTELGEFFTGLFLWGSLWLLV